MASKRVGIAKSEEGFANMRSGGGAKSEMNKIERLAGEYEQSLDVLRQTFRSGATKSIAWRRTQLKAIVRMIEENTDLIGDAIRSDLGGPKIRGIFDMDAYAEALMALKNLDKWAKDEYVGSS